MANNVEIIEIIKDFEGIIGAILGSVSTLLATDFLRKRGILKIYLMNFESNYYTNDMGTVRPIERESDKIHHYSISYKIQVYNKSDTPKIMRDFKIMFFKDKKVVYTLVPKNESTRRYTSYTSIADEMEVSNVMSREVQTLEHSGVIMGEKSEKIEGATKIELLYYDEKDKIRRVLLYKGVASKTNHQPKSE